MRKLSFIVVIMLCFMQIWAQKNPHGKDFKLDCSDCHTAEGWKYSVTTSKFNHNSTKFRLEGQHKYTSCAACHKSLIFSQARPNCFDCHTDMHNATVGLDCARCHDTKSWIVTNITGIHQQSRFPLLGAHNTADCAACHTSASKLEFQPLGIECIDCHRPEYVATKNPDHIQTGLSTNCSECHKVEAFEWNSTGFIHDFFPLSKGHSIPKCADCHVSGTSGTISRECYSCHQEDFNVATNPSHKKQGFNTSCEDCHTTDFDWKPAKFDVHDNFYFPVYSGTHRGTWQSCSDCHKQPENYQVFSCIDCHEHNKSKMDGEHDEQNGYSYNSLACFACHPTGKKEGSFNHSSTDFPLTGAHIATECTACHKGTFAGTPAECTACHNKDYTGAQNPVHTTAGISVDCKTCHGTSAWVPSSFNHTATSGFGLSGGHSGRQCAECHKGNTNSASPECVSCHQQNYNAAPNHSAQKFPLECSQCHNTTNWNQSTFDHGKTVFPLTGAHLATECAACHKGIYTGTPTECNACHQQDFSGSLNPSHTRLGLSTDCQQCHTTNTGWEPAKFPDHAQYFAFKGAHVTAANNCFLCHKGNYNNTPNTCFGCHSSDYNATTDPVHSVAQFSTDCQTCHTETAWKPATFNHDVQYFAIYSGKHQGAWGKCSDCHAQPANYSVFTCVSCHEHNKTDMDNKHAGRAGYIYNSVNCLACHPRGSD